MNKIKVLQCFGSLNIGGAETLMMNLLSKFDLEKFQIDFLVFNSSSGVYEKDILKYGCNIYRLSSVSEVGIIRYIRSIEKLIINNGGYDVVHTHMDWLGGFISYAAYKAGVNRRIVHSHAIQGMFDSNLLKHFSISISKILIKKYATDCIACSTVAAKSLFLGEKFTILKNAVDLDRLNLISDEKLSKLKNHYKIKNEMIILGNIGSMSENKNQIFLIKILEKLNEVNSKYVLFLVGNGPEEEKIKQYVIDRGIDNIYFENTTLHINYFLSLFDIFLFPSYNEGFGMIALEAQAMGLPCIISNGIPAEIDINADLIERCTTFSINEWKQKIEKCKCKKRDLNKIRELIIQKGYDIESCTDILQKIYEGDLSDGRNEG